MGKDTVKVKRKCCQSTPPCKRCPIVVLRQALKESKERETKKQQKKEKKQKKKTEKK